MPSSSFLPTGKLLQSFAASNLLPSLFMLRGAPSLRRGIFVACLIGYVICLIGFYQPSFSAALQNIAISCAMLCYFNIFYIYYKLRTTFSCLPRNFRSPFGFPGAAFACAVFALVLISTLFYQKSDTTYTTLISTIGLIFLLSVYYFLVAKSKQVLFILSPLTPHRASRPLPPLPTSLPSHTNCMLPFLSHLISSCRLR
jgi:L-asparagine transporter-like permease